MKKRNKNEIAKAIINGILIAGAIVIASTSPYFIHKILPKLLKHSFCKIKNKFNQKKFYNVFYRLKSQGLIRVERRGGQIYISLTEEGKKKAGRYQINDLKIKKPKGWDKKWRILIFDIQDKHRIKREALRGELKKLGLYKLQKSVWIHPYDFTKEIKTLRSFFGLTVDEMKIILASKIENDKPIKSYYKI